MFWRFCLILFIGVLLEWKLTHSAPAAENGKTKEKVRAYEFGFSIEEQQHRHEKRDENGIVMGEFGFITADGIYHVTVYATDENGKFKIISMKNYPYGGSPEKKIMIARLPPAKMPVVTTTKQPTTIKSLVPDGSSCGGCVKPKKMNLLPADVKEKKPDDEKAVFRPLSKPLSNGKTNGEAVKVGKSTPTSKSVVGGNGKGTTGSKVPGSQPLVPPKVSAPGAQKSNGATSSKNGPGKNDKYDGPLINVRLDSDSLTPPKTSTPGAKAPTTPSKNGQGILTNDGNKFEITKSPTQTTPTQVLTQIPKINEPSFNTRFDDEDLLLTKTRVTIPSKFLNALATPNNKQIHNSQSHNTNKIQNTFSKTATTSSQSTQNQNNGKATYPNSPTAVTQGGTSSSTTDRKPSKSGSQNKKFLESTISSNVPNNLKTKSPTQTISSLKDSLKKSTLATPDTQFTNENNPTNFNTRFSEEDILTERNQTPSDIKTTATPSKSLGNTQALYNTELPLNPSNPTVQTFGPSTNQNTKTTPQQYTSTQIKTNPTRNFTQFPKNNENTVQNPLRNQIIPSSHETNFPPAGENLQSQKSPNSSVIPTIPSKTKPQTVLNSTPTISSISQNNPTKSFTVPTKNGITPQYQKGSTNTATQNTARPILKTTKEPKSFQTLSKVLPDEDNSIKNRIPQTSTLTTVPSKTTVLQKPGQSPSLVTSRPQLISKNTMKTQPQLTTQTLIPKRLQQNTNEAKTTTTNTQSTNKQTPATPSKQSTGKTTSSTNPAAGSGGISGASSSGSAAGGGGGGGPLYKFNYVLDYNSHREEGRIDGSKEGNYNTIDEDGIRRIIDYIANENGYQPHIKLERLPPNEVPTGENKLKEYEFVWFN